jgi:hypothetical protein
MTSFKDFLEKEVKNSSEFQSDEDFVSVQALGKFYLKIFLQETETSNRTFLGWKQYKDHAYDFEKWLFDSAVDCLGTETVEKKMRDLKWNV